MRKHAFVTTLLGLLACLPAFGQPSVTGVGTLEAHGIGRADSAAVRLRLSSVLVDATPAGDEAETRVEHLFENAGDDRLEGTFRFLLPDGARLTGLALEVNGRLEEGSLVEREEARRIFQTVVDQMGDPALLEWDGGAAVQLRVFPIEPNSTKRVVVRFLSPLSREVDG